MMATSNTSNAIKWILLYKSWHTNSRMMKMLQVWQNNRYQVIIWISITSQIYRLHEFVPK